MTGAGASRCEPICQSPRRALRSAKCLRSAVNIRPIFLLSSPRAGSTLVQRVIAADERVATTSEPWLLLPLLYGLREDGARAEYWHAAAAQAISDFCANLPDGSDAYRREVAQMARTLYREAAGSDADFFLDKTPHYHFIVDELLDLFDDASFVFLWRNPLSVVASLLHSFRGGRWEPWLFRSDLFDGVAHLTAARERAGDRAFSVRYEDLIAGERSWHELFDHLGLGFDPALLERFAAVKLTGRYGDPSELGKASAISAGSADRWRATIANPVRTEWSRRYLEWIGTERLALMGYDRDQLLAELESMRAVRWQEAPVDLLRLAASRRVEAKWRRNVTQLDSPLPLPASATSARRVRAFVSSRARGRDGGG